MDISILFYILIIAGIGAVIFLLLRKKPEPKKDDSPMLMLQQQINHISQVLDTKLSESNKNAQFQFNQSAKIIGDVRERLAKLDETNRQVVSFADQLQGLQDILKNPKQRGILGEYYLETVLKNDNRRGEARDPKKKKKIETLFINDLKLRIDETSKYVKPEEKTMDFAFMFIPSEAVYYDLLINKVGVITEDTNNLIYYAGKKKVVVVSPTSFLAYLQTVLQGMRNQKISEQAQTIIKEVEKLGKHLFVYSEYMKRLGQHLDTTVSSYNKAGKELQKIDKDVVKLTAGEAKIEIDEVERPMLDE